MRSLKGSRTNWLYDNATNGLGMRIKLLLHNSSNFNGSACAGCKKVEVNQLPKSVARSPMTGESSSLKQTMHAQMTGPAIVQPNLHDWKFDLKMASLSLNLQLD